jgi:hypothetical protein
MNLIRFTHFNLNCIFRSRNQAVKQRLLGLSMSVAVGHGKFSCIVRDIKRPYYSLLMFLQRHACLVAAVISYTRILLTLTCWAFIKVKLQGWRMLNESAKTSTCQLHSIDNAMKSFNPGGLERALPARPIYSPWKLLYDI